MKNSMRRFIVLLLALSMVFTTMAVPAFAAEETVAAANAEETSFDNSTTLPDGAYPIDADHYTFTGGTGKAKLTCTSVEVVDGKAYGYFTASSANMTHVYLGHTASNDEDPQYYDPNTGSMGEDVYAIDENQEVKIPVKLNQSIDIAARTAAMSEPHWIQYNYTISLEEPEEETDDRIAFAGDNFGFYKADGVSGFGMLSPQDGSRIVLDGDEVKIYLVPKNTTVYNGIHWGSITDEELTRDVLTLESGCWEITVSAENCGYGIPAAPVKPDGGTTSTQYYLCIPSKDKLPVIADYTGVDQALSAVPADLSGYTAESVQAVTDAVAVTEAEGFRMYSASEQETVDAAAKAINDAVAALEEEKPAEPEKTELTITNNTGMFKAVTAYLTTEDGQEYLVMALSSSGYKELFKGTYEQAVANGDGTADKGNDTWVHSYTNEDGKLEFKIALGADETYVPCVAISNSYYTKYLNGTNALERAFYPRQFEVDREAKTLVTGDYDETADFAVTSNVADFKAAAAASTRVVGGPNSNNYNVAPTLAMEDTTYDKVTYPTVVSGKLSEESAELTDGKFAISLLNAPNTEAFQDKTPIKMTFHVAADAPYEEAGTDVERTVTIDKMAKTIVIDGTPLTEKAARLELAVDKTNAGMMKPAATAYLDGEKTVILPMENDSFSAIFVGDGSAVDEAAVIALAEDKTFTFEAPAFDEAFTVAFKSKKNGNWLNKKITVSKDNATLVIVDDKADYTAVDAAIAAIPEDLSIYTEESAAAVESAKAAVKTGKNSVEQAAVDEMAKVINDAVAALELKDPVLTDGTYTATKVTTDVTTEASGMIMVTKATVVIKDGQATAIVTMKGTGADRLYVSDTATKDTIIAEAIAEENKEVGGEFGNLIGGLKFEGESAYSFWPIPITLGEPKVYAARSASHFSKQDKPQEEYYYVHDFKIDAADLTKVSDSTELPVTAAQEAQKYLNQYFLDGKVVTSATAASVKGKAANVTIPYYDANGAKISSVIFKMAESGKFRSGWFVDSSILNTTYFTSSNLKKIRYPEGASGKVTFNPKAAYRDEGMTFTATLKLYPADAGYDQYDSTGVYYDAEPLAEQEFAFTVEPLPGDRHVTITVTDAVSKEEIAAAVVTVTKNPEADGEEPAVIEKSEEGTYALTVPGTYTVKVSAEGYLVPGTEDSEYVQADYVPKKDGETLKIELIKAEESKNTITFDLKDQMGGAVAAPTISVYRWDDKTPVEAEADGSYKLYHGVRYGYTVTAEGYEETTATLVPAADGVEEAIVNKYLTVQKFTFKVYDNKTNETLEGVTLVVKYGPSSADPETYAEAQPDENGVYTIPIDNRVIAYGSKLGYEDGELGVWSLGFDPLKECSFGLKPYPALAVDKTNAGMMKPAATAYLDGEKTVILPMENDSFSAIFVGDGREVDEARTIALAEDKTFTFEAPAFDEAFTVAFKSKKNGNWLNKKITVSKENATLVIVDDKADYTAVDAAIAAIPEDLSDYTEESKAALEAAKAAVKTGKNSVEQAAVDEMAKAITDAVSGLKIDLANVEFPTFKVKTYSGIEKTPTFTPYYNGQKLVRDTDYTAEYSDNLNVGEATIVVTGKGKYGGTATLHFTIAPKEITPKLTQTSTSLTWNGKNRSPGISVYDGSTKLVKGTDYTIKMAATHSSVGKWTITVNLCGNYKGSAKTTFNIIPKGTDVTKVQSKSSKTFTVTWKKQATKMSTATITGYQIQWSTDSKFKTNNHTKMVAGYNTTSYTIDKSVWKGIEGGKKYYVRIRTYRKTSSGTYYSSWSDEVLTVTTKK